MHQLLFLSLTDLKLIFRDPALRVFLIMPLLIFALVLYGMPALVKSYESVEIFIPIVLMGATMQTSVMFGFIYCMVFIHEKDIDVARVYGVLPVSKTSYLLIRLFFPFLIASLMTLLLLIVQPFYIFSFTAMFFMAILCGLMAPLMALIVSTLSKNKMEGMTWFKLVNLLVTIPYAAFFISKFTSFFGIIPTHWAYQALDKMIEGESSIFYFVVGFVYVILMLVFFGRRFTKVHFM